MVGWLVFRGGWWVGVWEGGGGGVEKKLFIWGFCIFHRDVRKKFPGPSLFFVALGLLSLA